jgi:hypothetical protein
VPELSKSSQRVSGLDVPVAELNRNRSQARKIADELKQADVEVLNDVVRNQVVVTFWDDDRTRRVIASIQDSGRC